MNRNEINLSEKSELDHKDKSVELIETASSHKNIHNFEIRNESGELVGTLELCINNKKVMGIGLINIIRQNQGYATLVYKKLIATYPGHQFTSSGPTKLHTYTTKIWESLVKEGLAKKEGNDYFVEPTQNENEV